MNKQIAYIEYACHSLLSSWGILKWSNVRVLIFMDDTTPSQPIATFEGEQVTLASALQQQKPGMIGWVIAHSSGAIKNEKQAGQILLALIVVMVLVSLYFFFSGSSGNTKEPPHMDDSFVPANQSGAPAL